jgi:RNA polymerase sigma-70 factor (sigma-E family)
MADRSAFEEFVAARSPRLLRVCYLLTQDWGQAEDLLQTALAKAWFRWGTIGEPEAYVRAVITNTYASWWRRRWRGEVPTEYLPERAAADATPDVDERDQMWAALGRLPRRQRAVLVLRFFEDLTERQTADALGISVGTVKSQTARALASLRIDPGLADPDHPRDTPHEPDLWEELS